MPACQCRYSRRRSVTWAAVEPTAHPKVLRSPADPVSSETADLIETLIQSALNEPDNWDALRIQLRALVPDFHVPRRRRPPTIPRRARRQPRVSSEGCIWRSGVRVFSHGPRESRLEVPG